MAWSSERDENAKQKLSYLKELSLIYFNANELKFILQEHGPILEELTVDQIDELFKEVEDRQSR